MPARDNQKLVALLPSTHENIMLLSELYATEMELPKVPIYTVVDKAVRAEIRRLAKKLDMDVQMAELDR